MGGPVGGTHGQGGGEDVGRADQVERVHFKGDRGELLPHPCLPAQGEDTIAPVEERPLLGDEVEAVPHRVDEEDVVTGQGGDRSREVVRGVEKDRCPPRRAPLLVDAASEGLDLLAVCEVLGQPLS